MDLYLQLVQKIMMVVVIILVMFVYINILIMIGNKLMVILMVKEAVIRQDIQFH